MSPLVDFDLLDSILRVLVAWELGNDALYWKYNQKIILIQGGAGASLEGFRGTLGNRRRVGRVGRRIDSAKSERMRATSGKSSRTETLYVTQ